MIPLTDYVLITSEGNIFSPLSVQRGGGGDYPMTHWDRAPNPASTQEGPTREEATQEGYGEIFTILFVCIYYTFNCFHLSVLHIWTPQLTFLNV